MNRRHWTPPKDPSRSLNTRSLGLMRKAMDMTNLDVQVAIFVEGMGKKILFKTDPDFIPDWNAGNATSLDPSDLLDRPGRLLEQPSQPNTTPSDSPFTPGSDFSDLMGLPTESPAFRINAYTREASAESVTINPGALSRSTPPLKRRRSDDGSPRPRKRESVSSWFD